MMGPKRRQTLVIMVWLYMHWVLVRVNPLWVVYHSLSFETLVVTFIIRNIWRNQLLVDIALGH
jgi:hypothetical protein